MPETWTREGLCADLGISLHQLQRWIHQGAMPGPDGVRKVPLYTRRHYEAAKRIRDTLAGENQPRNLRDFRDERAKRTVVHRHYG